ncbi:hypothetical protein I549_1710 [Mycobacterium avium subsp. avium 2285 (R)]|nr:hypothetical protein I549_1710 [Mycobacterium avium subsp. avium 2285 (R)]
MAARRRRPAIVGTAAQAGGEGNPGARPRPGPDAHRAEGAPRRRPEGDLRSALTWLCNAQSRIANSPSAAHSREVLLAAYEVKRVLATAGGTRR